MPHTNALTQHGSLPPQPTLLPSNLTTTMKGTRTRLPVGAIPGGTV